MCVIAVHSHLNHPRAVHSFYDKFNFEYVMKQALTEYEASHAFIGLNLRSVVLHMARPATRPRDHSRYDDDNDDDV